MTLRLKVTPLEWILFGLVLHALGGMYFNSFKIISYVLCGLGLVIISSNALMISSWKTPFKGVFGLMFTSYLVWSIFIIIRPLFSDSPFERAGYSLINPYTLLSYTAPFVVFLGFRHLSLKIIFRTSIIYGIIGIFLLLLNYTNIFTVQQNFDSEEYQAYISVISTPLQFLSATSFLILCYPFVSMKQRLIGISTMFLALFTVLFTARRSSIFMYGLIFIFVLYLYLFTTRKNSASLKLLLVLSTICLGFLIYNGFFGDTFSLLSSRMEEDTRSGVEQFFFYSFEGNSLDWIIGRGINGTYYCPIFFDSNRATIETGYLYLILKGGIIYLSLFVFLLAHSAFYGWFRTNNKLTKGMALYLVAHIIYLIPYGLPAFNFEYIVLWVCLFYCQSRKCRSYTDFELKRYLSLN